ncbi:MAG: glycosyltransferase [Lachnospiraceae bacterium]|nr:glycosyltransferase [Lachnospiraceae bacterium]
MDPINVCLLNDSFPPVIDGVANTVVNYANIIKADGLGNPFVITPKVPGADDSGFAYPVLRYNSVNIGNFAGGYRAGVPLSGTTLVESIKLAPDVIHTHCPVVSTMIARELRHKCEAPIIFTYHTKFDVDIAKAVKNKHLQGEAIKIFVSNITSCDEVWVVSEGAGQNLKSLGYKGDYLVMNNGVDFPKGKASPADVDAACQEYGVRSDVPVLMFVGRLFWYKGIRIILDALAKIRNQTDFQMVFIGKGADEDEIKAYTKELHLDDKVLFTGPIYDREKLRAMNTRGDLFLFPSTYDTNGLVVREAAACGLPSVVIAGSCAAEGMTDGRNGFFCEENADSMAAKLLEILSDMDHLYAVGEHAMNEIYISWQDAIHTAYERYMVAIEKKKAGDYKKDTVTLTDEFYRNTADFLIGLRKARTASINGFFNIRNAIVDGFEAVTDAFKEASKRIQDAAQGTSNLEDFDNIGNQDRYI